MSGMLAQLRRLGRDQQGAIAVVFALLFPVLIAIAGIGIETGIWYTIKRHNQAIADVAAYSGAFDVAGDSGDAVAAAKNDAKTNGFDFADAKNTASTVSIAAKTVTVTLRHQQTPMLVSYFQPNAFTIINKAVASVDSTPSCASSVGKNGVGLELNGGPIITMPGCTITSNSKDPGSISLSGNATINAFSIYTAGGVSGKGSATLNLNVPAHVNATALPDKYCLSASDCVSVPSSVTGFTMPTLPSAATTFPTLAVAQAAPPNNTHFASAPSLSVSSTQPGGNGACDGTVTPGQTVANINKSCYLNPNGVTITGSGFTANKSPYYFVGPVTITGGVTMAAGVDIYVVSGSFTVANGGTLTVAQNGGKSQGSKAGDNIWVATGSFNASAGTVTFNNAAGGDTTNTSAYAIQALTGINFGSATFNSGLYSFYGSGLTIGAGNGTTALGPADYYIDAGGVSIASGGTGRFTASTPPVTNPAAGNATNLTINGGNFTSNGTLTFNNSGISGVNYSLVVPNGGSYALNGGAATFGANSKFGLYGGGLTVASGASATFNGGANFYLDSGDLAMNGPTTFAASSSASPTTVAVKIGNVAGTGAVTFTGGGTSQYNICTGGITNQNACGSSSGKGVVLGGTRTFGAGAYYFMNSSSSGSGVAVTAGTSTFAGGSYSIQNGGFSVANGATASFAAGTPCAPTGGSPPAGSCVYLANGGFSNAGTTSFATGTYYLYDPTASGTSFNNTGTLTLGTTGSNNFYINNAGGAFVNTGTVNFGAGNYYLWDGNGGNSGNDIGGFASAGTLNFTGSAFVSGLAGSNYYFYNGPAVGTGNGQSCSSGAGGGNPVYGALSIEAGSTGNFGPGNYYAVNGALCINQTSGTAPILTCGGVGGGPACVIGADGITFILTGSGGGYPGNVSTLQVPGPITSSLSAPGTSCSFTTPGCYQGLLFFQDADRVSGVAQTSAGSISGNSCSNHSNCSFLDGGDNMALTGAVYIPQSVVDFKSNNSANTCLVVIAEAILFSGNSTLTANNCSQDGVKTLLSTSVSLTQ